MTLSSVISLLFLALCPTFVFTLNNKHTHSLAFNTYDLDQSGFIDSNELNVLVHDLFDKDGDHLKTKSKFLPKQMKKLYQMLDLTGDGKIDQVEFVKIWHHFVQPLLNPKTILLVYNMQNDYLLPNGSMYTRGASSIVTNINPLLEQQHFDHVFYIRDYHPQNHCSFNYSQSDSNRVQDSWTNSANSWMDYEQYSDEATYDCQTRPGLEQKIWPRHCVQGTIGADFYSELVINKQSGHVTFINKGTNPMVDSYSAIFDNAGNQLPLSEEMNKFGKTSTVYLAGLMLEYEIYNTALQSINLGHPTVVLSNAVWSKDAKQDEQLKRSLMKANVIMATSEEVYSMINGRDRRLEAGFVLAHRLFQKYSKRF